ncbi:hypothetical protein [Opitutus terrae]|uniref:Uncharacterized protein n=1 Tax=Opitutus terrae (strain DSM 11246 / JCM 15787 / PB90-1) TaxID=452637 RepID=B1ZUB7_OPITP|nr:hypothetical protein [Opitutus terrae]ACB76679.1 hypothetical protein Oter_3402 [Opitutus terrae PB90-1]
MPVLDAKVRQAAAAATLQFDWLLPDKPFLRVAEIAARTGLGTTFIEEAFGAAGKCHRYNGGDGKRDTLRIPRAFAIELLVRSAKYDAETKVQAVESLAREFAPDEALRISAAFQRQAFRGQSQRAS